MPTDFGNRATRTPRAEGYAARGVRILGGPKTTIRRDGRTYSRATTLPYKYTRPRGPNVSRTEWKIKRVPSPLHSCERQMTVCRITSILNCLYILCSMTVFTSSALSLGWCGSGLGYGKGTSTGGGGRLSHPMTDLDGLSSEL